MTPSRRRLTALAAATTLALTGVTAGTAHAEVPPDAPEQVKNGDFSEGVNPWFSFGTGTLAVTDGRLCAPVAGGLANPWDAGIGQSAVPLLAGAEYRLSFDVSATTDAAVKAVLQLGSAPYTGYATVQTTATAAGVHVDQTFTTPADDPNAQLIFQVGGSPAAQTFCLDNVSLRGGEAAPPYEPDTGPRVRVNQVGYLPAGPKNATVVTDAADALPWQLKSAAGAVVASGETSPRGVDPASGQHTQTVDFSAYRTPGTGYTLVVDGETSHPFDISGTLYEKLRADSLQFFYAQRSGTPIDGDLIGAAYARPAGHLGVAPNQGDTDVPCQAGVCDYRLDVRGGWYDAGDHGKYVVNGGIATYQLLNAFERTKTAATAGGGAALGDATLRVPERGNKVPDILDEARWELEFLLRMQVPAGQPLAGMAHHKIHDRNWTGLPLAPQDDPQPRELHPPSTAATLNLAAVAAQCARLFAPYDAAFAARCGTAAKTAYVAAKAHPTVYATTADGNGGGAYEDNNVTDEFYWAAVELWLTTGNKAYLTDLSASPAHTADVFDAGGAFGWQSVAALGRLDLATVPNTLPAAEKTRIRASVAAAADRYLTTLRAQAYGLPLPADAYVWGSNSNVVNNAVVLGTAFDLTGDAKYRDGAVQTADYLLGRNALNMSYVTGWGEQNAHNQHSRIFAHQLDPNLPNPPAGSLAGGPNSGIQDPYAANLLAGCKPMFCYVDNIDSYSTNEIAINWNSALAWLASFLADQGDAAAVPAPTCAVTYTTHGSWPDGFTTQVTLRNTGSKAIDGWSLRWAFTGDQKVSGYWSAQVAQSGATVTAKNLSWNAKVAPGAEITFGLNGSTAGGPNPNPTLITLNGSPCTLS
ncbi:glycoside hydrolase family 9 protein [Micromonospora auratinigra]|uniref:Endoglucanase n=1 Tax=Micromonospora auratinigra TaxID=261654 RepID=A0A1A8Z1U5_9ACTN|nr:glycoside hydrolase family 9 protein [Micromonospora auratinigra]SBT37878.1 Carbohydrate binding domain-containing protein [Micromonospora auratinigra]